MEGRPWTNPEQDRVLAQGRSSGECQSVTGAPYRGVNSEVTTAPNTQSRS